MTRNRCFPICLIVVVASVCAGQTTTHVSVRSETQQLQALGLISGLRGIIGKLDTQKLRPTVPGSFENEVLSAARESARHSLRISLEDLSGVGQYTLTADEGDILVARWNGANSGRAEKATWLWDTPFYTIFVMEVNSDVLQWNEFKDYCEGLFHWKDFIDLTSLKLAYLESQRGKEQVTGLAKYIQTEQGSYRIWFAAMSDQGIGYVAVGMSKSIFSDKYPKEAYQVAERFPPLRSRLTNVSRQALLAELGKGYAGGRITTYPMSRDEIVVRELLTRGQLTQEEVHKITIGDFDKGDYESAMLIICKLSAFLQAVGQHDQLVAYAPALERIFLDVPIQASVQDAVIGHVFGAMESHNVDFSHASLAFAQRGKFMRQSLHYLKTNIRDEGTLRKLVALNVGAELETEKRDAINTVRSRLASK